MGGVTILRQHYQYEMVSSKAYRTSVISAVKYDNTKKCLFLLPVHDILEDLEIRGSDGALLMTLSEREAMEAFGVDVRAVGRPTGRRAEETLEMIPVLLEPSGSEYAKVVMTYVTPIRRDRYEKTKFSPDIGIDFRFKIIPGEFAMPAGPYEISRDPFDVHILFKAGDDYRISRGASVKVYPDGDGQVAPASENTENASGFFVRGLGFDDVLIGSVEVGLADSLLKTAKIISLVSAAVPAILLALPLAAGKFLGSSLEILGISIALLIGERVWVLKDKFLMMRWVGIQKVLLAFNGAVFLAWVLLWSAWG